MSWRIRPQRMSGPGREASLGMGKWLLATSSTILTPGALARMARDFVGGDGAFAFDGEGFGVGSAEDGDADAGGGDADVVVAEDFFGFLHHLDLFFVVAGLGVDLGVVAEEVEGVGVGEDGVFVFAVFEVGAGGFAEFFHGRRALGAPEARLW